MHRVPIAVAMLLFSCATTHSSHEHGEARNAVTSYLCGAELQAETSEQRANLRGAFLDLSALPSAELRARRYADYGGVPNQWDLIHLLDRHFVAAAGHPRPEPEAFWKASASDELRTWARRAAQALDGWNTGRPKDVCGPSLDASLQPP